MTLTSRKSATEESLQSELTPPNSIVFIVDDDVSVRESLTALVKFSGWPVLSFGSAEDFLDYPRHAGPSCIVLDVALPHLDGLELQNRLTSDRADLQIIFISGNGDVPMTVRAMKAGATEFLTKPIDDEMLLGAIGDAIQRSAETLDQALSLEMLRADYSGLTKREREVFDLIAAGQMNKQVGGHLGISEITVKAHRGQVMRKMKAKSFAALVNMAARLGLPHAPHSPQG